MKYLATGSSSLPFKQTFKTGKLNTDRKNPFLMEHFADRLVQEESEFYFHSDKSSGYDKGYIAVRDSDEQLFMIKIIFKEPKLYTMHVDLNDFRNFINEFVTASMYKRMLYDRAPLVEAMVPQEKPLVCLRSKFLEKFSTISKFTNSKKPRAIGNEYALLKKVEGAEKLFASIIFAGEFDIHSENLGVMTINDESGAEKKVFAKVDHGWSATNFFTDPTIMFTNFYIAYINYGYYGKIDLDLAKFIKSFEQILEISDYEIDVLICSRVQKIKELEIDIDGLELSYWQDDRLHDFKKLAPNVLIIKNFEELKKHYTENYKNQKNTLNDLKNNLTSFQKIWNDLEKKPYSWLKMFIDYISEEQNLRESNETTKENLTRVGNLKQKLHTRTNMLNEKKSTSFLDRLEAQAKDFSNLLWVDGLKNSTAQEKLMNL